MKKIVSILINIFPFTEKYITDQRARTELFLKLGLTVNVGYAVYNIFTGVFYRSVWFGGVAVYYIMLCLIKFFLITRGFGRKSGDVKEVADLRICSVMLLVLNLTIAALICQMIWQNKSHLYASSVIYGAAVYTLFRLCAAIYDTVKLKKLDSPTLYAAKVLSLSVALMSVFSFQTSVLDILGVADGLRRGLNIVTGAVVSVTVISLAVRSMFRAQRYLKRCVKKQ